jgi:putative oxidoreductase
MMTTFDLALLILRLAVGLTFAAHGAQKAFGWWSGPGPAKWAKAVHSMTFHPPMLFAAASIGAELGGGIALALGFMTPVAAAILIAQAIVISVQVHLAHGFFSTNGGLEFPFVLGCAAMAVGLLSAGAVSLDALVAVTFEPGIRLLLALLGVGGGFLVLSLRGLAMPERRSVRRAH